MIVVQIAGRLGKDAETRFTTSGLKVTTLTLATNIRKGKEDVTVWWRVTIWGDRYDKMAPYFKKGTALIVIGDMHKPEIWTDKEGRPQVSMEMTAEIVRFSPFGGSGERTQEGANAGNQASPSGYAASNNNTGYATSNNNAGYGSEGTDFGGSTQGTASRYVPSDPAEEQIPF
jgi:single-strand DNA-binding protein